MNDNVKKVFEILGVEPNERFKIRGFKGMYFIDVDLWLRNEEKEILSNVFVLMLRDPLMIVKLPKDPSKKKLRDLTPEEWDNWQVKNCDHIDCNKCVFTNVVCYRSLETNSWINNKDIYSDKFLDQEIEVEE